MVNSNYSCQPFSLRANQVVLSAQPPSSKKLGILQTITGMANLSKKVMKFDGPFFENRHFEPVQAQCSAGPASVSRGKSRARVRPRIAPDFLRKLFTSRQNLRHPSLHTGRHGLKWTGKSSEQNLPDPHFWVMCFFWASMSTFLPNVNKSWLTQTTLVNRFRWGPIKLSCLRSHQVQKTRDPPKHHRNGQS